MVEIQVLVLTHTLVYPLCAQAMPADAFRASPAKTGTVGRPKSKRERAATAHAEDSGLPRVSGEGKAAFQALVDL